MSVIRFRNVTKKYEDHTVLQDFDMEVRRGETMVLMGGSGSGKSTILKMVVGLVSPDSGSVFVDGEEITRLREEDLMPIRRKIGIVFQEGALFDSLTVRENVAYRILRSDGYTTDQIDDWVLRLLGFVGMQDAIDKMPSELSGGMKRRVAIARALMGSPRIMLYDEPTAGARSHHQQNHLRAHHQAAGTWRASPGFWSPMTCRRFAPFRGRCPPRPRTAPSSSRRWTRRQRCGTLAS